MFQRSTSSWSSRDIVVACSGLSTSVLSARIRSSRAPIALPRRNVSSAQASAGRTTWRTASGVPGSTA
ncbi:Uncharacterised protein [Mycobacteroides abscessus]|nr:Uncharacterised protein [Mycobacteroides abscessus]